MAERDLLRVDQRLAIEPEGPAMRAFGGETGFVIESVVNAVENGEAEGAGGGDRHRQKAAELRTRGIGRGGHLLGEVVGAHHQRSQAGGGGNLLQPQHRARSLDHRPERHRAGRRRDMAGDIITAAHLGDEDRINRSTAQRGEIITPPGCVEAVNAHDQFAPVQPVLGDGDSSSAGGHLRLRRNRILEIDDDHIRIDLADLGQRLGVGARHIKGAASGAEDRSGHRAPSSRPCTGVRAIPKFSRSVLPA